MGKGVGATYSIQDDVGQRKEIQERDMHQSKIFSRNRKSEGEATTGT